MVSIVVQKLTQEGKRMGEEVGNEIEISKGKILAENFHNHCNPQRILPHSELRLQSVSPQRPVSVLPYSYTVISEVVWEGRNCPLTFLRRWAKPQ